MKKMKKIVTLSLAVLMLAGLLPLAQKPVKGGTESDPGTVTINHYFPDVADY